MEIVNPAEKKLRRKNKCPKKKTIQIKKTSFCSFIMLEKIYYNEINLDDEGNFKTDIIKNNAVDKKKSFWLAKNTLLVAF